LQDVAASVDAAHGLGMGVMMDIVLHPYSYSTFI
jgi:glycosidase